MTERLFDIIVIVSISWYNAVQYNTIIYNNLFNHVNV